MSSRDEPSWPFTSERASDPDRLTTPASEPTGPLFDALDAPLPSELERAERARSRTERERLGDAQRTGSSKLQPPPRERVPTRAERTDVVPRRDWRAREERRQPQRPVRPRPGTRRVRRTIKHIDPISVLKISAFFYAIGFVVWLILAAILYWFLQSLGLVDAVAETSDVFAEERIEITLGYVERWAFVIGLVMVVVGCFVNTAVAFLYNVASDLFGGVQVTFAERDG